MAPVGDESLGWQLVSSGQRSPAPPGLLNDDIHCLLKHSTGSQITPNSNVGLFINGLSWVDIIR